MAQPPGISARRWPENMVGIPQNHANPREAISCDERRHARQMGLSSKPEDGCDTTNMKQKTSMRWSDISATTRSTSRVHAPAPHRVRVRRNLSASHPEARHYGRAAPGRDVDANPNATGTQNSALKSTISIPATFGGLRFPPLKGLPERLLDGRIDIYINFCLDYLTKDSLIREFNRKVYVSEYSVRANDALVPEPRPQDALDVKQFPKLEMPVLGLGSSGI